MTVAVLILAFGLTEVSANILAARVQFTFWGLMVPGGALLIPIALLLRDQLHLNHRPRHLWMALGVGFLGSALTVDFAVLRIAVASLLAYLCAFGVDTLVFAKLRKHPVAWRMRGSNWASIPVDTLVFVPLAFGGVFPLWPLIGGQLLAKLVGTEIGLGVRTAYTRATRG